MNNAVTLEEFQALFREELKDIYPQGEIDTFFLLSLEDLAGILRDEVSIRKSEKLKPLVADKLISVIQGLKTQRPIQYILGSTEFYGCKIRVNEQVLIPRPETEELVHLILSDVQKNTNPPTTLHKGEINVLDIGTGSGCIAIALKKKIPNANVSAIDISDEALLVAKANAILNQTKITFLQADILAPSLKGGDNINSSLQGGRYGFDVVVSNPPYIRLSEKEAMHKNVLEHEPHLALFVNDNDPLLFYKHIADFALNNLSSTGKLYFEINEALGNEVKKMMESKGFKKVEVKKDMSGKDRITVGSKQ